MTNFGSDPEWGALAHEANKKARHLPLRQLFGKIPNVLTRLAPCVMMSPLSIAQYLPADTKPFDVVIFDEASQVPVWDAIGAIARGSQVVVVGDPQQLPPTSVGQRTADGAEDDYETVQTQQSILDECLSSNLPSLRLTWHYRSRHESLIAFSNAKYYAGELVTFPSPVTRDSAVRFVEVPGGIYERGKAKVNRKEADAVVDKVVKHLRTSSQSIGIVTFNSEQQKLIENKLDAARRSDPSLDAHFDRQQTKEPVFIKNIENVQGDERDLIVFFVAVAPDEAGRVTAQISSLNGEGGHRRLNVAVTRARHELIVFSTASPAANRPRPHKRARRDRLQAFPRVRATRRARDRGTFAPTGGLPESPFEEAVKKALEAKGWQVHPQIGVSYFRIDLGIVNPHEPGRYLAGIECNGATYHRSATARDRDRLREMHLTSLGWRIRRIWSTEWWIDAAAALDKVHRQLLEDLSDHAIATAADAPGDSETTNETPLSPQVTRIQPRPIRIQRLPNRTPSTKRVTDDASEEKAERVSIYADRPLFEGPGKRQIKPIPQPTLIAPPTSAMIAIADRNRFYDEDYFSVLRTMVDEIVAIEGPAFFDLIVERISTAHGFQRAKAGIRGKVETRLGVVSPSHARTSVKSFRRQDRIQPRHYCGAARPDATQQTFPSLNSRVWRPS